MNESLAQSLLQTQAGPAPAAGDSDFARVALEWRLLEPDELARAEAERQERAPNTPILDYLVWLGMLTPAQAQRVEGDFRGAGRDAVEIPGYEILERIGSGGMGEVYKARQLRMDRVVAVKVLKPKLSRNAAYIDRFLREAKLAAKLAHNNIVQAIDAGQAQGQHYLVMELVEGRTVRALVRERGRLAEAEALGIALQMARALEHASQRDMVHRDIKPENILVTAEGVAKLADMGLARLAEDSVAAERGTFVGSVYFVAPEQIRGAGEVDSRADIYALGGTLFMMLAGRPPFEGELAREVLIQHLEKKPPRLVALRPDLSEGTAAVVDAMLAKAPGDRYPTPADLAYDLECLLAGRPPRLARERLSMRILEELAEGEAVEESRSAAAGPLAAPAAAASAWLPWALAAALLASLVANAALWLRK